MKEPPRLWQALDAIPGLVAVREEWRHWLGGDLGWVERHLLRPTGELATVYVSEEGEPFRVVDHGGGRYRAVSPDGAPALDLTVADIAILQLDVVKLAAFVCAALGCDSEPFVAARAAGRSRIGTWSATSRTRCPVWLCIQPDRLDLCASLHRLVSETDRPFVVLTPGPLVDPALAQTFERRAICHLSLSEALVGADAEGFALSPAGKHRLEIFRQLILSLESARAGNRTSSLNSDDRYEWARQIELVRATNQVLGQEMLNKGVLSRACAGGHIETNRKSGRAARIRVLSFLAWLRRRCEIGKDEEDQVRNAVIGEITSRDQ